jgi:hypothetical protein
MVRYDQCCSQGQNCEAKTKAKDRTLEAKDKAEATTLEAKASTLLVKSGIA